MSQNIIKQFVSFLGAGAIATVCHYAVLVLLVEAIKVTPVPASSAGALVGAFVSYFFNRKMTFQSKIPHKITMPKFFAVAALAVILNTVLMKILTGWLLIPYLIAQIITTGLLIIITFGLNKIWSFKV